MSRYENMFQALEARNEGAFVPFVMLGDPNPEQSFAIIEALIAGGADALELGIPFSDPVADGPTIQRAHLRAAHAGVGVREAFALCRRVRDAYPEIPMGLLVYANVAFALGFDNFYEQVAAAGIDSVLLPDVPVRESAPFTAAAIQAGVDPIYIAPPHASEATLRGVAGSSRGYVYAVSRVGVTGAEVESSTDGLSNLVRTLADFGAPPALVGFGISRPEHVRDAIAAGAAGAISGSAVVAKIAAATDASGTISDLAALCADLQNFVSELKKATGR